MENQPFENRRSDSRRRFEPAREVRRPSAPVREERKPPEPIREVRRPPAPIREVRRPPAPVREVRRPAAPAHIREARDTLVHPAPAQFDSRQGDRPLDRRTLIERMREERLRERNRE